MPCHAILPWRGLAQLACAILPSLPPKRQRPGPYQTRRPTNGRVEGAGHGDGAKEGAPYSVARCFGTQEIFWRESRKSGDEQRRSVPCSHWYCVLYERSWLCCSLAKRSGTHTLWASLSHLRAPIFCWMIGDGGRCSSSPSSSKSPGPLSVLTSKIHLASPLGLAGPAKLPPRPWSQPAPFSPETQPSAGLPLTFHSFPSQATSFSEYLRRKLQCSSFPAAALSSHSPLSLRSFYHPKVDEKRKEKSRNLRSSLLHQQHNTSARGTCFNHSRRRSHCPSRPFLPPDFVPHQPLVKNTTPPFVPLSTNKQDTVPYRGKPRGSIRTYHRLSTTSSSKRPIDQSN